MNLKVIIAGAVLELGYLIHLFSLSVPSIDVTPMFVELSKHVLFNVVVMAILLIGAFTNGNKKRKDL